MSTLTKTWTAEKIRAIIRKLDEKTGLNGASLPIKLENHGNALGYYRYFGEKQFGFKPKYLNNPNTKESEVIDVIRHEYAHYYVDVTGISKYFTRKGSSKGHNIDWKWACKMVGANPNSYHQSEYFSDKNWNTNEALAAYNADDISAFDILTFIKRWDQVPLDTDITSLYFSKIRERNPDFYYERNDEVFHIERGFGVVLDTIPYGSCSQSLYIQFEDKTEGIFNTKEVCKISDGVIIPYRSRKSLC